MEVLVTGGSGKVGKYVARRLAASGHGVANLDIALPIAGFGDVRWIQADILDHGAMGRWIRGFDAVVHLAGIPIPLFHPAEEVFRTNVMGTYNVVEAAANNGIPRFVYMSSESTLGFAFMERHMNPAGVPMDEGHALRPQDAYGASKVAAEETVRAAARRTGMETVILRPPWIWVPEPAEQAMYHQLVENPHAWYKQLWAFCGVEDVAAAVECALAAEIPHGPAGSRMARPYFICADENWTGANTRALLEAHYHVELAETLDKLTGAQSVLSNRKAKRALGWSPKQTAKDFLG